MRTQSYFAGRRALLSRQIGRATCQRCAGRQFPRVPARPQKTDARAIADCCVQPVGSDVTGCCHDGAYCNMALCRLYILLGRRTLPLLHSPFSKPHTTPSYMSCFTITQDPDLPVGFDIALRLFYILLQLHSSPSPHAASSLHLLYTLPQIFSTCGFHFNITMFLVPIPLGPDPLSSHPTSTSLSFCMLLQHHTAPP